MCWESVFGLSLDTCTRSFFTCYINTTVINFICNSVLRLRTCHLIYSISYKYFIMIFVFIYLMLMYIVVPIKVFVTHYLCLLCVYVSVMYNTFRLIYCKGFVRGLFVNIFRLHANVTSFLFPSLNRPRTLPEVATSVASKSESMLNTSK